MPEFDVQTPTGHVLTIDAPDEQTALAGAQQWHQQNNTIGANIKGAVTSFPSGFVKGMSNLGSALGQATSNEMGQPEQAAQMPSGQETFQQLQKHLTGQLPVAPNMGGAIGSGAGEMAAYNPIGALNPSSAIGSALASSTFGEAAKTATKGTPYEKPAEILANVLGPGIAAKTAAGATQLGGKIVGGMVSGAGENVLSQGYKAGVAGGDNLDAFITNMRKQVPQTEIVNQALGAVNNLARSRGADYEAGVAQLAQTPHHVGFGGADQALRDVSDIGTINGIVTNEPAARLRLELHNLVDNWRGMAMQDPMLASEKGIHDLKRAVGQIRDRNAGDDTLYGIGNRIYHGIQDSIGDVNPVYKKMTTDYAQASNQLDQLRKTFSLNGPDTNMDSALRKLISVTRDNANTNYGARTNLAGVLEQNGAPNLGAAAAGQASQAVLPRGLPRMVAEGGGLLAAGGAAGAGAISPFSLAAAPLASPRAGGEAAQMAGRISRYLNLPEARQTMQSPSNAALMAQAALAKALLGQQRQQ